MSLKGLWQSLFILPVVSILSLATLSAYAASSCKGLDESACKESQLCSWVSGYTTKNGNSVAAYCRSAGKSTEQDLHQKEGAGTQSGAVDRTQPSVTKTVTTSEEIDG